jgi:hypothetical protein
MAARHTTTVLKELTMATTEPIVDVRYAVARNLDVISGWRTKLSDANADLKVVEDAMAVAGLTSDVQIVETTITTTYSDPTPYVAPSPEPEATSTTTDASTDATTPDTTPTADASAPADTTNAAVQ